MALPIRALFEQKMNSLRTVRVPRVNKVDKGALSTLFTLFTLFTFFPLLAACTPRTPLATAVVILPTDEPTHLPSPTASLTPTISPTQTPIPPTATATLTPTLTPTATLLPGYVRYETQSGDTLTALAARFGTTVEAIECEGAAENCPKVENAGGLIPAGVGLIILDGVRNAAGFAVGPGNRILPDSEFIFSAEALGFDVFGYVEGTEGYLKTHRQYLMLNGWNSGVQVIELLARENGVNPRLLLALLEYQCGCVLENPGTQVELEPFLKATSTGYIRKDLWGQLNWVVRRMWAGYSGWRAGTLTEFTLKDGTVIRPDPTLNAGTVAVQYFFAFVDDRATFEQAVGPKGFAARYAAMFGDPWPREGEIFPAGVVQPDFILPFEAGTTWSFTGGPHAAYDGNGPLAGLDFAPALASQGCVQSDEWVLAVADGVVVRVEEGVVVLDLDGETPADGVEQTGWDVLYLHLEARERVMLGTVVKTGDRLGHPSCEGGVANGTHVHLARKFNGEWLAADGALPFNLGGWIAHNGDKPYKGTLTRGEEVRTACTCSWREGWIVMSDE